jgi:hypothetical protein
MRSSQEEMLFRTFRSYADFHKVILQFDASSYFQIATVFAEFIYRVLSEAKRAGIVDVSDREARSDPVYAISQLERGGARRDRSHTRLDCRQGSRTLSIDCRAHRVGYK